MIKRILHDLNLWYFPEFAPEGPQLVTVTAQTVTPKTEREEVETVTVKGLQYKINEDESWERYRPGDGILEHDITQRDEHEMEEHDLDRDKYVLVKACLCERMTAEEASAYLSDTYGRGYKIRTVQKYWASIRRAAGLSPTTKKRGGGRKSTHLKVVS